MSDDSNANVSVTVNVVSEDVVAAHDQKTTIKIVETVPAHIRREKDPYYHLFNAARNRLKRLGKLTCWIGNENCSGQIELHHSVIEFSLANDIDIVEFEKAHPEFGITDDESFMEWIEGEGNLTPLCKQHHTGILGIHVLPYPLWLPMKFAKHGVIPAHAVFGSGNSGHSDEDQ